ncbi:hypothetical protein JZ751_015751 [Albula glossodonta]|uniref:long-chain-fatty-acid--CoA ligase n=1 Tax=Albula glossodonta TaxID=121402 RepID=A0A8T2MJ52_9TELE|nr:hypothetical protein JZ751_015751 [Albula glossodonta]
MSGDRVLLGRSCRRRRGPAEEETDDEEHSPSRQDIQWNCCLQNTESFLDSKVQQDGNYSYMLNGETEPVSTEEGQAGSGQLSRKSKHIVIEEEMHAVADDTLPETSGNLLETENADGHRILPLVDSPNQSCSPPEPFKTEKENGIVPDLQAEKKSSDTSRDADKPSNSPVPNGSACLHEPVDEVVKAEISLATADQLWTSARDQAVKLRMSEEGPGSEAPMTICQMFQEKKMKYGSQPALASKKDGVWVTLTYDEYYQKCRAAAKSFLKLGLERYHGVGILGFNSPEWFIADIGCIMAGWSLDSIIQSQRPNECCTLIYTSGTTGNPKGVMLSHDNITWTANAAGTMTQLKMGDEAVVSYLPLSHVAAQVNDMWICMRFAGTTYFAEPDALKGSLVNTLREVRPTSFLGVPRVWEKMQESMKNVGAKASVMKQRVAAWAKAIGLQASYNAMNR